MKKFLALALATMMVFASLLTLASCSSAESNAVKVGVILIGDENEGYTAAHINGINGAMKKLGYTEDQVKILWKYKVEENASCKDTALELVDDGCTVIFSNSYGHQSFMEEAAKEHPSVQFVSVTGDRAVVSELSNLSNAFTLCYESRYVSGIVAGMKIKELDQAGKLTDANKQDGKVKVGYVGAFPYAEVVSGYTAFFLGIQSVYPDVTMEVTYTQTWFSIPDESAAAKKLAANGCVIIGQHADSTGAPSAIEELHKGGQEVYSVGYNIDMLAAAPTAALTSASNNWEVYYEYAIKTAVDGKKIDQNWAKGYADDAVSITALGPAVAQGTQAAVDAAIADIKAGTLHVFDVTKFTVGGSHITSYMADVLPDANFAADTEAIKDGYFHESEYRSAPYFTIRIDGIVEDQAN